MVQKLQQRKYVGGGNLPPPHCQFMSSKFRCQLRHHLWRIRNT